MKIQTFVNKISSAKCKKQKKINRKNVMNLFESKSSAEMRQF